MKLKTLIVSAVTTAVFSASSYAAPVVAAPAAPVSPAVQAAPAAASTAPVVVAMNTMNATQQKQIEDVVHSYLVKNPEVIVEAIQSLQQKQMTEARKTIEKTQATAPKFVDNLFHQTTDPMIGNVNGKVTVVDFFDYQCPHCTHMTPILDALVKANPDLRVVFKEFPIRGPVSDFAAKAALAAKAQGKYFEFHKALMQLATQQSLTEELVLKTAESVGLNIDKLKTDMKSDAVAQQIKANYKLGQDLQLIGTPAFFIATTSITKDAKPAAIVFIPGQIDQVQLQAIITKAKS